MPAAAENEAEKEGGEIGQGIFGVARIVLAPLRRSGENAIKD